MVRLRGGVSHHLSISTSIAVLIATCPLWTIPKALQHLVLYGLDEERSFSQFFNLNYYKANNPDLVAAKLDGSQLLEHFENYSLNEGRSFCVAFDVDYYRNTNSDLHWAGFNNKQLLEHFEEYGLSERLKW